MEKLANELSKFFVETDFMILTSEERASVFQSCLRASATIDLIARACKFYEDYKPIKED